MTDGLKATGDYTFGEFTYRSTDNTLRRNGEILSMTPKALDLLRIFLANAGKLLPKNELMDQLWPDSFVEEGNLAVTIRRLRKALADDAHSPVYVETVARQGYRFIAEVEVARIPEFDEARVTNDRHVRYLIPLAVTAGLLIASMSLGSLYFRSSRSQAAPILSAPFGAQKLSTSGKAFSTVISPDGEKVVYTVRGSLGDSVWLREIASENNVEIIPASDQEYYRFAFSPDGNTLYFTRGPRTIEDPADVYSVSIFGGIPKKLVSDTRGWISVSPDGRLLSFVRCAFSEKENCSLLTANIADGGSEKKIASRPHPLWIADHEITPDGRSIIFAAGQTQNASSDFGLVSVDLETGTEREITAERFFNIKSLEILPDDTGLLFTASRGSAQVYRVWKLDYADGAVRPLTKDSNSYVEISLDDAGSRLIATQMARDFRLVRTRLSDPNDKDILAEQVGVFDIDSKGGIVFQSDSTGDAEIWQMNPDGTALRQLTNVPGGDGAPVIAADASEIYFCSNRSGEMHVWRMNADGSDQRQVTKTNGGMPSFADKDWIYFQHGVDRSLWRVSPDGVLEESVLNRRPYRGPFVFSPTGTQVAFIERRAGRPAIVIISMPDAREISSHELADGKGRFELAWLPDERSIAYTLSDMEGERNSLWIQPVDGGPPRRSASLGDEEIGFLSFGPDPDSVVLIQGCWRHDIVMLSGLR